MRRLGKAPSWSRDYRKEAALVVASVVFSLLLAELALRWHYVVSFSGSIEDLHEQAEPPPPGTKVNLGQMLRLSSSPRLVYELIPGLDVDFHGTSVRTNAAGWREADDIPLAKAPGTLRVVGIGDSVMFGWRVEEPERYLDVLEEELGRADPTHHWDTVPLAVPGYNLAMEVEALLESGLAYSPDVIIYGFSDNDFCLPNFVVSRREVASFESFLGLYLKRALSEPPSLVERLDVLLTQPAPRDPTGRRDPRAFFDTYCSPDNVQRQFRDLVGPRSFARSLDALARIGRERGVPVVFFNYGAALDGRGGDAPTEIEAALSAVTRHPGLVVVDRDLLASGRLTPKEFFVSETDPHPSAAGHRLIAEFLLDPILELALGTGAGLGPPSPSARAER